ncbi:cyclase family protein [Bordetella petrii]|nr:cyclase family protein [Bordetella petrii]
MCDSNGPRGHGWRGWIPLPSDEPAAQRCGPWVDLSHALGPDVPRASVFPQPTFQRIKSLPQDPLNVTEMRMVVHIGTHVDAPRHFFNDGPAFHEIPLERLSGPGVVLRVRRGVGEQITPADLEQAQGEVRPGDIVALATGWGPLARTHDYHDHPYLSPAAAQWLVDRRVKLLACDLPTPDMPVGRRPADYDWPAHHILLGNGVLVAENIAGLDALAGQRLEFVFSALNIEASDGAPARVMARPVTPL